MADKITLADIAYAVESRWDMDAGALCGPGKRRSLARPRQIAMFLAREMTTQSLPQIGAFFNRDHTTVLWGVRTITKLMVEKPKLAVYVRECRAMVKPRAMAAAKEMSSQPLVKQVA